MNKKKKLFLTWTIPTAVIITAGVITVPVLLVRDNKQNSTMNSSVDYQVNYWVNYGNQTPEIIKESIKLFNPSKFTAKYFYENCLEDNNFLNTYFSFENKGLTFNENNFSWISKEGVEYKIKSIKSDNINSENVEAYNFSLVIQKTYEGKQRQYETNVKISKSTFSSESEATNNFVSMSANRLNEYFESWDLRFIANENISEISEIKSPSDLTLQRKNYDFSINKKNDIYYIKSKDFKFDNKEINFSPVAVQESIVLSSNQAYDFTAKDTFNESNILFTFLKNEYSNNHLLYLPELTTEEANGLLPDTDGYINKQIQKLIFNPTSENSITTTDDFGNKVPSNVLSAIVTKVALTESVYTYIVTWTKVLSTSLSIIESAPELKMEVLPKDGVLLNWDQLNSNKDLIQPIIEPSSNLIYTIKNVSFASDDEFKTKAIVRVEISHPDQIETKEYETDITTGFRSKAYLEMETQINSLISSGKTISPTITTKATINEINEAVNVPTNNYSKLASMITINPPSGLSNVKYTIKTAWIDGNQLKLTLYISSINDVNNYWTLNGNYYVIEASMNLPSTLNNIVSIDS